MLAYTAGDGLQAISRTYGIDSSANDRQQRAPVRPMHSVPQHSRLTILQQAMRRLAGRR